MRSRWVECKQGDFCSNLTKPHQFEMCSFFNCTVNLTSHNIDSMNNVTEIIIYKQSKYIFNIF